MLPLTYLAKHVPRGGFSTLFIFILCVRARVFFIYTGLVEEKRTLRGVGKIEYWNRASVVLFL